MNHGHALLPGNVWTAEHADTGLCQRQSQQRASASGTDPLAPAGPRLPLGARRHSGMGMELKHWGGRQIGKTRRFWGRKEGGGLIRLSELKKCLLPGGRDRGPSAQPALPAAPQQSRSRHRAGGDPAIRRGLGPAAREPSRRHGEGRKGHSSEGPAGTGTAGRAYLQHQRLGVEGEGDEQLHALRVFQVAQQEAARVLGLGVAAHQAVEQALRGAVHQVGPALHGAGGEQPHVAVQAGELGGGQRLQQVAAAPAGGAAADLGVDVGELLRRAQALQHDAAGALAGLPVPREVHVLHVEEVQQAQAAPALQPQLPVEELAAPAGAPAGRALIELQEAPLRQLVALQRGQQRVRVQHQRRRQAAQHRQLHVAVQPPQLQRHQPQHRPGPRRAPRPPPSSLPAPAAPRLRLQ